MAGMTGRAAVDRQAPPVLVLGEVRGDRLLAQLHDEVAAVVTLVGTQRHPRPLGTGLDQRQRGQPLGVARSARRHRANHRPVAVLHQRMPHKDHPRFLPRPFAKQPGVRIGGREVGVVFVSLSPRKSRSLVERAFFSVDGTLLEAWASMKSFRPKRRLGRSAHPGAQQQALHFALCQHRGKELLRHLAREQLVAVLRGVVASYTGSSSAHRNQPARPTALRADRIKGLQRQRPHQPLRRDRAAPARIRRSVQPAPRSGSRESPAADDPPEPASPRLCN